MYKMVLRGQGNQQEEMGGICATLCAFWIGFHAAQGRANPFTRDRAVWDYLFNGGGLDMGAAMNIVVEHHQSTGDQLNHIAKMLANFKVKKRTNRAAGATISHAFVPLNATTSFTCAREITENYGYKLIQIKKQINGGGSGHMLCAYCDGQDVRVLLGEHVRRREQLQGDARARLRQRGVTPFSRAMSRSDARR